MVWEFVLNNFYLFQTESVVYLYKEISLMILVLFLVSSAIQILGGAILNKNKQRIIVGLILYPILILILYGLLYFLGGYLGFSFSSISPEKILDSLAKGWWCFFIFWPIVSLRLVSRLFAKDSTSGTDIVPIVFAPIYEEFAFRFLAINTLFLITNSIEIALLFSAIAFSLIHLPNRYEDGWGGPVVICTTFIGGITWGIIAIKYGLVFSIAAHMIHNLISKLTGKFL